eukprot:TRINITY_DN8400_c0_g1_i3.p1 TRINITY_DN8400_c0_g1~~TRINITY_DN8400_c0_g1_i3.p1  ORF type:complete len:613 (+),score=125.42 TRINITY_DN8400_c0_g1_i3:1255-3093(+)
MVAHFLIRWYRLHQRYWLLLWISRTMPWPVDGGAFPNKVVSVTPKILVTAHQGTNIRFWDASGNAIFLLHNIHLEDWEGPVTAMALCPESRTFAVSTDCGIVSVYKYYPKATVVEPWVYNPQGREKPIVEGVTQEEPKGAVLVAPGWHLAVRCIWPSGILSLQLISGADRLITGDRDGRLSVLDIGPHPTLVFSKVINDIQKISHIRYVEPVQEDGSASIVLLSSSGVLSLDLFRGTVTDPTKPQNPKKEIPPEELLVDCLFSEVIGPRGTPVTVTPKPWHKAESERSIGAVVEGEEEEGKKEDVDEDFVSVGRSSNGGSKAPEPRYIIIGCAKRLVIYSLPSWTLVHERWFTSISTFVWFSIFCLRNNQGADECCLACIDSSACLHIFSLMDLTTILTTGPIDLSDKTSADFDKKVAKLASSTLDGVLFLVSKNSEVIRTAVFPAITETQKVVPELCEGDYNSKIPPRPVPEVAPQGFFGKMFSTAPTKIDVQGCFSQPAILAKPTSPLRGGTTSSSTGVRSSSSSAGVRAQPPPQRGATTSTQAIQGSLADTKETMQEMVLKMSERGDAIAELQQRSEQLNEDSANFAAKVRELRKQQERKNSGFGFFDF